MKILKFTISGDTAFFRNPDTNEESITFSYGQLHKVALMGILGGILGFEGHNRGFIKYGKNYTHPEFYKELKDIKIAIAPNAKFGYFNRSKQTCINNAGYSSSSGLGQTLIYHEQFIENVSWDIYINLDSLNVDLAIKLEDYIINNKAVYYPYLGKTNHYAEITNTKLLEGKILESKNNVNIDVLFPLKDNKKSDVFDMSDFLNMSNIFEYRESLPISYSNDNTFYKTEMFIFTNKKLDIVSDEIVFAENKNIIFY